MKLNINNIVTKLGDGNKGWIEQKPFDRIIITAATKNISLEIIDQTKEGGIIVAPIIINNKKQILRKFTRVKNKLLEEDITEVSFVPNISGVPV